MDDWSIYSGALLLHKLLRHKPCRPTNSHRFSVSLTVFSPVSRILSDKSFDLTEKFKIVAIEINVFTTIFLNMDLKAFSIIYAFSVERLTALTLYASDIHQQQ